MQVEGSKFSPNFVVETELDEDKLSAARITVGPINQPGKIESSIERVKEQINELYSTYL